MYLPTSPERGRHPPSYYLKKEFRNKKEVTPVDSRGLVDEVAAVRLLKSMVEPECDWQDGRGANIHHLYNPEYSYKYSKNLVQNPKLPIFRELAFHKLKFPWSFHEFWHDKLIPPKVPEKEVVENRIVACLNAMQLFPLAYGIVRTPRSARDRREAVLAGKIIPASGLSDIVARDHFNSTLEYYFEGFEQRFRELIEIPPEFRLVDINETGDSPREIATVLGKIGVLQAIRNRSLNFIPQVMAA